MHSYKYSELEQKKKELLLKKKAASDFYKAYLEVSTNVLDFSEDAYSFVEDFPAKIAQRGATLYMSNNSYFSIAI